jgi:hypothetical protein
VKFRRQHPLGANYIVDFCAPDARLAIELDGSVHDSQRAQWADGIRHRQIQVAGVHVLRFRNERVLNDLEAVLNEISENLVSSRPKRTGEVEMAWCEAKHLLAQDRVIVNEAGQDAIIEAVEFCSVSEMVYDLIVEEDHSFITEAGVALR